MIKELKVDYKIQLELFKRKGINSSLFPQNNPAKTNIFSLPYFKKLFICRSFTVKSTTLLKRVFIYNLLNGNLTLSEN